LFDPNTPDTVFAADFNRRYGNNIGEKLLEAYALASRMPLRLASFHSATWDYTLYSEGFLAPVQNGFNDKVSPFISIDELIKHKTLDPAYLSIPDYVESMIGNKNIDETLLTPLELADDLDNDGNRALKLLEDSNLKAEQNVHTLNCEIADVQAWACLSLYFADKLRAGVELETFRKTKDSEQRKKAILLLENAAQHWKKIIEVTQQHYHPVPAVQLSGLKQKHNAVFSWQQYNDQVQRDIQIAETAR
jgi:hypothetical protein